MNMLHQSHSNNQLDSYQRLTIPCRMTLRKETNIVKRAALLMTFLMMMAATGSAEPKLLHAQVPFPFAVYNRWLPAGSYIIRFEDQLLRFRSDTINAVFIGEVDKSGTRGQPKLNFKVTNEGYRLCTVPGIVTNYCK